MLRRTFMLLSGRRHFHLHYPHVLVTSRLPVQYKSFLHILSSLVRIQNEFPSRPSISKLLQIKHCLTSEFFEDWLPENKLQLVAMNILLILLNTQVGMSQSLSLWLMNFSLHVYSTYVRLSIHNQIICKSCSMHMKVTNLLHFQGKLFSIHLSNKSGGEYSIPTWQKRVGGKKNGVEVRETTSFTLFFFQDPFLSNTTMIRAPISFCWNQVKRHQPTAPLCISRCTAISVSMYQKFS